MKTSFIKGSELNIGNKYFVLTPSLGIFHNLYDISDNRVNRICGVYLRWGYWWAGIQFSWKKKDEKV